MPHTLLIVDDSATMRSMVKRTVRLAGFDAAEILEAADGRAALDLMGSRAVDLVLADLHMPNMGGVEMTRRMAEDPRLREIPVVVVSADPNADRIEQLKRQGVRGYLAKPFTPESLRDTLVGLLGVPNHE